MISSRTPEGVPNRCPVCGSTVRIEPSSPARDAPCPVCGSLLWFSRSTAIQTRQPAELSSARAALLTILCVALILIVLAIEGYWMEMPVVIILAVLLFGGKLAKAVRAATIRKRS
jgi:uncharacterized paraquat-inducible protein A